MMVGVEKPARCANTEQAAYQKLQDHFTTQTVRRGKLEFIQLTSWLSIVGG
jgi:hypothetical protein